MNIEIKGIVKKVSAVVTKTGTDKTNRFQNLIITVPGYTDGFGEKKGKHEDWQVQLINDVIDKHKLLDKDLIDKKVIVKGYLNSRTYQQNGEDNYMLQINLASYEVFTPKVNQ